MGAADVDGLDDLTVGEFVDVFVFARCEVDRAGGRIGEGDAGFGVGDSGEFATGGDSGRYTVLVAHACLCAATLTRCQHPVKGLRLP
ncbi:hypothetical protein QFZ65_001303 [Arthrobacter sp. B3I9]|nr:hypothetical protein [Arthrobacter sp. B3I9]